MFDSLIKNVIKCKIVICKLKKNNVKESVKIYKMSIKVK